MAGKLKYKYNIGIINEMISQGLTLKAIAANQGYSYASMHLWLKRHYYMAPGIYVLKNKDYNPPS